MVDKTFGDPIGKAILEYASKPKPFDIVVESDLCDDDIIPIEVLFRSYEDMPAIEQVALSKCQGKILDVGAAAGAHSKWLMDAGFDVSAIDTSPGAVSYLSQVGLRARVKDFYALKGEKYDTLLMLMNGIGLAGSLSNLPNALKQASLLLTPNGKLLCDSSDVSYLYEDEDGGTWIDLNSEYHGNFRFRMSYKREIGDWFDWLYVDFDTLFKVGSSAGFTVRKIAEQDEHYLAELTWQG
jgi:hypothetical protein